MSFLQLPLWLKRIAKSRKNKSVGKVANFAAPPTFDINEALKSERLKEGGIEQLFWGHAGRLAHKWPHYFNVYERIFEKYRSGFNCSNGTVRPLRFLEIVVSHGGSLQLWRKYFGPDAVIYGIDIDQRCASVDDADLRVRIGSQDDPEFLHRIIEEMGGVDVVLDDGSHIAEHQRASFDNLFPLLSEGGLYVVEDVQTAYWRRWQGGYRRPGTFIELAKSIIDDMHARYHAFGAAREFAEEIFSATFYDGIVAFEKNKRPKSYHIRVGKPSF
jgi:hypothetical protein